MQVGCRSSPLCNPDRDNCPTCMHIHWRHSHSWDSCFYRLIRYSRKSMGNNNSCPHRSQTSRLTLPGVRFCNLPLYRRNRAYIQRLHHLHSRYRRVSQPSTRKSSPGYWCWGRCCNSRLRTPEIHQMTGMKQPLVARTGADWASIVYSPDKHINVYLPAGGPPGRI